MTNPLDDLVRKYSNEGVKIEENGTSGGFYTYAGLLTMFLLEAKPIIEAQYRDNDTTPTIS